MSRDCNGLPLAIVVVAGFLASMKQTYRTWSRVADDLSRYLTRDPSQCMDIISLSYYDLPNHLKPCFLYFGLFPQGFEIPARLIIQLWIAEGFIQPQIRDDMKVKPEDVGEQYLNELIDRSLVQVATTRTDGGVKTCVIHNLVGDVCIYEGAREKFFEVHRNVDSTYSIKPRRISVQCKTSVYLSSTSCDYSSTRTFLCFGQETGWIPLESLPKNLILVRVLDMGPASIEFTPRNLEKRLHLRYLKLENISLEEIAPAICNLWNLETLDVRGCNLSCLPEGIWNMPQLRHLYMGGSVRLPPVSRTKEKSEILNLRLQLRHLHMSRPEMPSQARQRKSMRPPTESGREEVRKSGSALVNLQTLSTISPDEESRRIIESGMFPNLTKLGIFGNSADSTKHFLEGLSNLTCLRTLKIMKAAKLNQDPKSFPLTLVKITLVDTNLSPDDIQLLGKLPSLEILKLLENSIGGSKFICSAGSFSKLKTFHMVRLGISSWKLEEGAMQSLEHVVVNECDELVKLPEQLGNITTLRQLKVEWPNSALGRDVVEKWQEKFGSQLVIYPPQ